MTNFTGWAVAAVAMAVVGCTTTADDTANTDGGTSTAATTAGAGGSSGTTTTTGSGGSSSNDAGDGATCAPSATPSACETCVFSNSNCHTEICACQADADCMGALPDYFTCLAGLDGGDMADCASNFAVAAANGAGKANELGSCINDAASCQNACSGKDGG